MIRFIHLADLHLGALPAYLGERAEERSRDFESAFKRAVDFACDASNEIDLVLVAGDLFDSHNPDQRLVALADAQFQRLTDAGKRTALICGTHDSYRYPDCIYRVHRFPKGVEILTQPNITEPRTISIRDIPVHLYGMSWDPRRSHQPYDEFKRADLPGIHIALIHGSVRGDPEWELESHDVPLSLEKLRQTGMHYVALGHYHDFREERVGGVTVVYPGTLEGRKFGENGPRFLVAVRIEDNDVRVEKLEFNQRMLEEARINFALQNIQSPEELIREIEGRANPNLILRVLLEGPSEFFINEEALRERVRDKLFHLEIDDQTTAYGSALIHRYEAERTIRGLFVRRMQEKIRSAGDQDRALYEHALKIGLEQFLRRES
jgi:exonuclease SbcD